MIDTSKFEKLEKEDLQEVSGGAVAYVPTKRYDTPEEGCDCTIFKCGSCGKTIKWQGVYHTGDGKGPSHCGVPMVVNSYYKSTECLTIFIPVVI